MKPFKSFLAQNLLEFIAYRENLGLKNRNFASFLSVFDQYVLTEKADWSDFTPGFFLQLQSTIPGSNRTVNIRMAAVHAFFAFLVRRDLLACNPLQDIPARPENRFIPFVFAPETVDLILWQIEQNIRKSEQYFLRDYTVYMAFVLLARCGMRISEPLAMTVESYRRTEKTLYIKNTKFHKDRLIPLTGETARALENYLKIRNIFHRDNRYLLPGIQENTGLTAHYLYPCFHRVLREIGIARSREIIGTTTFGAPVIHSFRHSFAVNTLLAIKKRGNDPQQGLPILAAYMGHRKYEYTAHYLKMIDAEQRNNLVDFTLSHRNEPCI